MDTREWRNEPNEYETQNRKIKDHLLSGRSITSKEAIQEYGIYRLASRIFDFREIYGKESVKAVRIQVGRKWWHKYTYVGLTKHTEKG